MEESIFIALIGAAVHIILSSTVPCLFKKINNPLGKEIKTVFENNRKLIITSSVIVAIIIYLAIELGNELNPMFEDSGFGRLSERNSFSFSPSSPSRNDLKYLVKLMERN
jgi:hypothetical protein